LTDQFYRDVFRIVAKHRFWNMQTPRANIEIYETCLENPLERIFRANEVFAEDQYAYYSNLADFNAMKSNKFKPIAGAGSNNIVYRVPCPPNEVQYVSWDDYVDKALMKLKENLFIEKHNDNILLFNPKGDYYIPNIIE
jgi:hypothetical protein